MPEATDANEVAPDKRATVGATMAAEADLLGGGTTRGLATTGATAKGASMGAIPDDVATTAGASMGAVDGGGPVGAATATATFVGGPVASTAVGAATARCSTAGWAPATPVGATVGERGAE